MTDTTIRTLPRRVHYAKTNGARTPKSSGAIERCGSRGHYREILQDSCRQRRIQEGDGDCEGMNENDPWAGISHRWDTRPNGKRHRQCRHPHALPHSPSTSPRNCLAGTVRRALHLPYLEVESHTQRAGRARRRQPKTHPLLWAVEGGTKTIRRSCADESAHLNGKSMPT
jgi:hypothetical protein